MDLIKLHCNAYISTELYILGSESLLCQAGRAENYDSASFKPAYTSNHMIALWCFQWGMVFLYTLISTSAE